MEMDDIVPEMQNQEKVPPTSGDGGGTCSSQDGSASRSTASKCTKATT